METRVRAAEAPLDEIASVATPDVELPLERSTPRARAIRGERAIARILRIGALGSGGLFFASLVLELLPTSQTTSVAIDTLQKLAASLLLATPAVRLGVAGVMLGLRGEKRYALYAAGVLALLGLAIGAGIRA